MAKAEFLKEKVVTVTCGTSPLGELLCEQAAQAGAKVFALDTDSTSLAQQVVRFRKNNLALRGIPCDLTSQLSVMQAIAQISSHAPPIDVWIHGEVLNAAQLERLHVAFDTFGQHFNYSNNGNVGLCLDASTYAETAQEKIAAELTGDAKTAAVALNVIACTTNEPVVASAQLLAKYKKDLDHGRESSN